MVRKVVGPGIAVSGVLAVLLLAACGSGTAGNYPGGTTPTANGPVDTLAQVSDVRPGKPILVFVYVDG